MSGRSLRESLKKLEAKGRAAYDKASDVVRGGKPEDVPLGEGAAERARGALRNRGAQLDEQIERSGG